MESPPSSFPHLEQIYILGFQFMDGQSFVFYAKQQQGKLCPSMTEKPMSDLKLSNWQPWKSQSQIPLLGLFPFPFSAVWCIWDSVQVFLQLGGFMAAAADYMQSLQDHFQGDLLVYERGCAPSNLRVAQLGRYSLVRKLRRRRQWESSFPPGRHSYMCHAAVTRVRVTLSRA